jgi:hypothetical protein
MIFLVEAGFQPALPTGWKPVSTGFSRAIK